MKKIISLVLCILILFSSVAAIADGAEATNVQDVLLKLKSRITVPSDLTEFSTSNWTQNEKTVYDFLWRTPDYEKSMSVSCDDKGRILNYRNNTIKYSDKAISPVTKQQLISYAEEFIKKALPEAFSKEHDALYYDDFSYQAMGNLQYSLKFIRQMNAIPVKDNYAVVNLGIHNDEIYVRNMQVQYNYDAVFEEEKLPAQDHVQKYMENFPLEMVYINEYVPLAKPNESSYAPKLIYRIKDNAPGYMDIANGDIIIEDSSDEAIYFRGEAADKVENSLASGGSAPQLTPEEMAEIEKIDGLMSVEEIEKNIKSLPYLKFPGKLALNSKSLFKDDYGDYYYRLHYSYENKSDYAYFSINLNAKTGEIIRISNSSSEYDGTKQNLTELQINSAKKKITEFLNKVCPEKFAESELANTSNYSYNVSSSYVRMVNGVKFIDNGISVSFDTKNNVVTSFNLNFSKGEFTNPADCVSAEKAYENLLEYSPVESIYILSGGKFVHAASLKNHYVTLDALTGDVINAEKYQEYVYSDIDGHWVQEAANKLSELQLGFTEEKLEPEKEITQEELLRFWLSGIKGRHIAGYSDDELYDYLISNEILSEEEKSSDAPVKREDAFVYLIRICKYEKIASLSDIYKVSYKDSDKLSNGKIGYAAILSGLGIICGDGGELRPSDALTRAEAVVMLYKYLLNL